MTERNRDVTGDPLPFRIVDVRPLQYFSYGCMLGLVTGPLVLGLVLWLTGAKVCMPTQWCGW